jgi:V/A-type H+/Na+-transporting ATPase subunit D
MLEKQVFPTKGNLIALNKSIKLAKLGYDLMDKKRNILTRELMSLLQKVQTFRDEITITYQKAYLALQEANMTLGVIQEIARAIPIDNGIEVTYRSIMGVEIPKIIYEKKPVKIRYGIASTNSKFDYAYTTFQKVRDLTLTLGELDNSLYRLAEAIRKSRKRANALKNIVIPNYQEKIKYISETLEEKEREDFSRKKLMKKNNM